MPPAPDEQLKNAQQWLDNDVQQALVLAQQCWSLYLDEQNIEGQLKSLLVIGKAKHRLGKISEAQDSFKDASNLAKTHKLWHIQIDSLLSLGKMYRESGELEKATECFQQALESAREYKCDSCQAKAYNLLASISHIKGNPREAYDLLESALSIYQKIGNKESESDCLNNIGILLFSMGDYSFALEKYLKAYGILTALENRKINSEIGCLNNLGNTYFSINDLENAAKYYKKSVDLSREHGFYNLLLGSSVNYSEVKTKLNELDESEAILLESLKISIDQSYKQYEMYILHGLGNLYIKKGDFLCSYKNFKKSLDVSKSIQSSHGEAISLIGLAESMFFQCEYEKSEDFLCSALEIAEKSEAKNECAKIHHLLSQIFSKQGRFEEAFIHHQKFHKLDKEIFNEENERQIDSLTKSFELQKAEQEAEAYRQKIEVIEKSYSAAEKLVKKRTKELEQTKVEVVTRLALAAEYRDDITGEHTKRVGYYAAAIALEFGIDEHQTYLLQHAARLHDVGKIGIPDAILLKRDRLTHEEFEIIKRHTLIGERILSDGKSALLRMARDIAVSHHERWDGKGYPYSLSGEDIPLMGRIVAVADVFDALTQARPYKEAWSVEESLTELRYLAGSSFDPQVVEASIDVFSRLTEISEYISLKDLGVAFSLEEQIISSQISENFSGIDYFKGIM